MNPIGDVHLPARFGAPTTSGEVELHALHVAPGVRSALAAAAAARNLATEAVLRAAFEHVVARCCADRSVPSRPSLLARAAVLETDPAGAAVRCLVGARPELPSTLAPGQLVVAFALDGEGIAVTAASRAGSLAEGLVDELLGMLTTLLARLPGDAGAWTAPHDLLPDAALAARRAANRTGCDFVDEPLFAPFLRQALAAPDRVALVAEGAPPFTYDELRRRATRLARELVRHGARVESPIAIWAHKGWEQVVAALAVTMAGAPYLPIEAELPLERVRYLLENGEVELALTDARLAPSLPRTELLRAAFAVERTAIDEQTWTPPAIDPGALAYVLYTSGSTGFPKGVMIPHRAALNTIVDMNRRFSVAADDRVLGVSALSFDLSVYDIFGTLAAGATLVLPAHAQARNPIHLAKLLFDERITVWSSVPAIMDLVAQVAALRHKSLPPSLRAVWLSGDWIPLPLPGRLQSLRPGVRVTSLGGATEASIWSIFHDVAAVAPEWRSVPYGKPLAHQRFHVLDGELDHCPTWVPGDLHIAGAGLARGYWRDRERTARSFYRHPRSGEELYRTGDLGRYLPDGTIEFLGRDDGQVKVSGFRIELGEIEATLSRHGGLRDVRVVARDAAPEGAGPTERHKSIVAYYIPLDDGAPTADALRAFLVEKLPSYMVPHQLIPVDAFPLTANGKLDLKALPSSASARTNP